MPNIPIEQITSLPDSAQHIWAVAPIAGLAIASYIRDKRGAESNKQELASHYGNIDETVLQQVIIETETNAPATEKAYSLRHRLAPRLLMTGGIALFGASLITHPTAEITTADNGANLVVAIDSSYAMEYTTDMNNHLSRFDAAKNGLEKTNYSGNLAVVQFGGNEKVTIPLSAKNNQQIKGLTYTSGGIDPNGANAVSALSLAASQLPVNPSNTSKRSGEVILISDGVTDITSQSAQIATEQATLAQEGVQTKIIVPGKDPATYNFGGTANSSIQPNVFTSFGSKNTVITQSSEGIAQAIQSDEKSPHVSKNKVTWYPPYIVGAALALTGYGLYGRKLRKVTV